jgi:hypothetical protein
VAAWSHAVAPGAPPDRPQNGIEADLALTRKAQYRHQTARRRPVPRQRDATIDDLKDARRSISERYYQADGGQLNLINYARNALEERGADLATR